MLHASAVDTEIMLVESYLKFCEMTRQCGDSDDLLSALAKTGFLEQRFEKSKRLNEIYPAVLAERAEILWERHEANEAVQSLRSLLDLSQRTTVSFTLIPKEIIFATLVRSPTHFSLTF